MISYAVTLSDALTPITLISGVGLLLLATAVVIAVSRAPDRPVQSLVARWGTPPSDFIEVNGHVDESPLKDALGEIDAFAGEVRVLGSYPVAVP